MGPCRASLVLGCETDGEERIIAALRAVWSTAPRQRCQEHFLGNLADEVLENDTELRKQMRVDLGGFPKINDFPDDNLFFEPNRSCGAREGKRVAKD